MVNRFLSALAVVGGLGGLVGCVDPRGNFDDFDNRVGTTDASTIDRPASAIFDITGTFLLSVHVGFETSNDPAQWVQFVTTFNLMMTGETARLDGSYMPLCTAQPACAGAEYRTMVPPALTDMNRMVNADGTFAQPIGGDVDGRANPITGGPINFAGVAEGGIISADLICGTVSGTANGIPLTGSTFAAIRITDTTAANLPPPIAACPGGNQPDAGVIDAAVPVDAPPPVDAAPEVDAAIDAT